MLASLLMPVLFLFQSPGASPTPAPTATPLPQPCRSTYRKSDRLQPEDERRASDRCPAVGADAVTNADLHGDNRLHANARMPFRAIQKARMFFIGVYAGESAPGGSSVDVFHLTAGPDRRRFGCISGLWVQGRVKDAR
jgi:hypothetical protein